MKRYQKYIKKGVNEPLSKVPFHTKAPLKRLSMLNKKLIPESSTHIAVHFVNSSQKSPFPDVTLALCFNSFGMNTVDGEVTL